MVDHEQQVSSLDTPNDNLFVAHFQGRLQLAIVAQAAEMTGHGAVTRLKEHIDQPFQEAFEASTAICTEEVHRVAKYLSIGQVLANRRSHDALPDAHATHQRNQSPLQDVFDELMHADLSALKLFGQCGQPTASRKQFQAHSARSDSAVLSMSWPAGQQLGAEDELIVVIVVDLAGGHAATTSCRLQEAAAAIGKVLLLRQ